jgi:hypothetical protein
MARSDYTPAERAAWQATQMKLSAGRPTASATSSKEIQAKIREAGSFAKYKAQMEADLQKSLDKYIAGKGHNSKRMGRTLVADTGDSTCFSDLRWSGGVVYATFTDGSQYDYDMPRSDAKEWFEDVSLGGFFNAYVR